MYTVKVPQTMTAVLRKDRNALKATGPRTAEGKAASSRNSLKHGLTARQVVIPGENQADFDQLLADIATDRNREGELEIQLAGEIAACTWRLARARAREAEVLETRGDLFTSSDTGAGEGFDRLLRYMGSIERQLNRATVRLQQLQADRRKNQHAEPEPKPKTMAAGASTEFVSSPNTNHNPLTTEFVSSLTTNH